MGKKSILKYIQLGEAERIRLGYDLAVVVTHENLTETATNTAQVIELLTAEAGHLVERVAHALKEAFKDASDNAFNSTTAKVGDAGDDDRFLTSAQLNENGTEILYGPAPAPATLPHAYSAQTAINLTVGSMSGKALADIDTGEVWVFFKVVDLAAALAGIPALG